MIFVGQRCPENCHKPVTEELIDRAFKMVNLGQRDLEKGRQQIVHGFRTERASELGGTDDIAEQHGDLLFLAMDRVPGGENALRQMRRGVGDWLRAKLSAAGQSASERGTTTCAEFLIGSHGDAASGTGLRQPRTTLRAETRPGSVLSGAA